jgi:hypothetical protein
MGRRVDPLELPEVGEWVGSLVPQPGWLSFLTHRVGLGGAVVVARLLWPQFSDIEGCVVIDGLRTESEVKNWLESTNGDVSRTESILNTLHLWDVFPNDSLSDVEVAALDELGNVLVASWRAALAEAFPGRAFRVEFAPDGPDYGPTVWFHSETSSGE